MKALSWPLAPLGVIALAIALFAVPEHLEGPILVPISPGHALSLLDSFAVLSLLMGVAWLSRGLWQRRDRLYDSIRQSPRVSGGVAFMAGVGLGLLIASAFSSFFWWWAIGAVLYGAMIIAVVIAVVRR
ncbi:MAG: hypothetical protein R6U93_03310 [Dehalococcoidia bacterium]|jgi:hypothetical protein